MTQLHQLLPVVDGTKQRVAARLPELDAQLRGDSLRGIRKTYRPFAEDPRPEDRRPDEGTEVRVLVEDVLRDRAAEVGRLLDVTLTVEEANTRARGDVVVDSEVILEDVPVSYLLFLEKQLAELLRFVSSLPVHEAAETWEWDDSRGAWVTPPAVTISTKKTPRNHVLAEATQYHPAQVQVYTEELPVGEWRTTKMTGALPATRKRELRERVEALLAAVRLARTEANKEEVTDRTAGRKVFGYLLGG